MIIIIIIIIIIIVIIIIIIVIIIIIIVIIINIIIIIIIIITIIIMKRNICKPRLNGHLDHFAINEHEMVSCDLFVRCFFILKKNLIKLL